MKRVDAKICGFCDKQFEKPYTCSLTEWAKRKFCSRQCKKSSQIGVESKKKGKTYSHLQNAHFIPCRICGEPTRYSGTKKSYLYHSMRCDKPFCVATSRKIKNQRISKTHRSDYNNGRRQRIRHTWNGISRISAEEKLLASWFIEIGWEQQVKFVTGRSGYPRCFWLDFANQHLKVCVEIDGTIHRLRSDRDDRRDAILLAKGWRTLRIQSKQVVEDIDLVKTNILHWIAQVTITEK
jgi:hypothetical protein